MKSSQLLRRWALALLLAMPLAAPSAFSAQDGEPPGQSKRESKLYIVQMADAPVVAYNGGIAGLKATRPNRGQKIDPNSPDVVRYADFLTAKHDDALLRVGGARKAYSYKFSFNGFAAELSAGDAASFVELLASQVCRSRLENGHRLVLRDGCSYDGSRGPFLLEAKT